MYLAKLTEIQNIKSRDLVDKIEANEVNINEVNINEVNEKQSIHGALLVTLLLLLLLTPRLRLGSTYEVYRSPPSLCARRFQKRTRWLSDLIRPAKF